MIDPFEDLIRDRRETSEFLNKKKIDIHSLVVKAYPDKAHFIYELLQNAEDTGAHNVHFELEENRLLYWHDGRPFDLDDIKSITSVGHSSKLDDVSSIGKFGIGFKAVFAYTDAPEIYSAR